VSEDVLKEISRKLDRLVALAATNAIKGMKPTEAILILGAAGIDRNVIAQVVGTSPATVSVRLSEAKAKKSSSEKKVGKSTRE
jgi:pyruvate/2-oxoglutarate dehydrogenase complex dihydrolipoamide dehydrogenase (E3) component